MNPFFLGGGVSMSAAAAVDYAEYAAHTAFKLQLVPYGPEPRR